jgi:hypothetical protein
VQRHVVGIWMMGGCERASEREREREQVPFLRTYHQGRCFYERFAFSSSYHHNWSLLFHVLTFIGLACCQGKKDIVLRFIIIEYSSLRDFYRPLSNDTRSTHFYMRIFER